MPTTVEPTPSRSSNPLEHDTSHPLPGRHCARHPIKRAHTNVKYSARVPGGCRADYRAITGSGVSLTELSNGGTGFFCRYSQRRNIFRHGDSIRA